MGKYEKMEICRKEPVMKMMVEHHFAGIPKVLFVFIFFGSTIYNLDEIISKHSYSMLFQGILKA